MSGVAALIRLGIVVIGLAAGPSGLGLATQRPCDSPATRLPLKVQEEFHPPVRCPGVETQLVPDLSAMGHLGSSSEVCRGLARASRFLAIAAFLRESSGRPFDRRDQLLVASTLDHRSGPLLI